MTQNPLGCLLAELSQRGVTLQARDGRLRYRPRSRVTPELAERLRLHKAKLLMIMQSAACNAAEATSIIRQAVDRGDSVLAEALAEAWEERLAICTADGDLSLALAEVVALHQLRRLLDNDRTNSGTCPLNPEANIAR